MKCRVTFLANLNFMLHKISSQQQPHAPVQVAGKPRKKEEASQQAEKKPRTRKPSITPKM